MRRRMEFALGRFAGANRGFGMGVLNQGEKVKGDRGHGGEEEAGGGPNV